MTSSTSSSDRLGRILPVAAVVLAILVGVEAATRLVLAPASNDFRSFATYPGKAAALDAFPGLRIALVGNSTARSGVDGDRLATLTTAALGRPVAAGLFVADSAEIATWHFMMKRFFWGPGLEADVTVLLFYGDGLHDSREPEIGRLAWFFSTPQDIPELFRDVVTGASRRLEYLASSCSMAFAARDRIRERILKALVPGHAVYARRLNDWQYAQRPAASPSPPGFRRLGRFLETAGAHGMRVVVVALPTAPSRRYEVPDALVATVAGAGMTFIDDRLCPGLTPDLFPDGLHLSDAGKAIYTPVLAEQLARLLASRSGGPGDDPR